MAEIRYLSEQRVETVVLLLPDVWNLPHTEPEEEAPKEEEQEEQEVGSSSYFNHSSKPANLSLVSVLYSTCKVDELIMVVMPFAVSWLPLVPVFFNQIVLSLKHLFHNLKWSE